MLLKLLPHKIGCMLFLDHTQLLQELPTKATDMYVCHLTLATCTIVRVYVCASAVCCTCTLVSVNWSWSWSCSSLNALHFRPLPLDATPKLTSCQFSPEFSQHFCVLSVDRRMLILTSISRADTVFQRYLTSGGNTGHATLPILSDCDSNLVDSMCASCAVKWAIVLN